MAIDLKKVPTRLLLDWLKRARACGGGNYPDASYSPCDESPGTFVSIEELKVELATRPHIPNKKEGKAPRRAASFAARGRSPRPKLMRKKP